MKVFVLGLPGSGKTTLGKALAKGAGVDFVDLDADIERTTGMSIRDIFKKHGEDYFRKLESEQLKQWCGLMGDFVMATGGGTPCFFDNMVTINHSGSSIFLDVPSGVIALRLQQTDLSVRPLFADTNPGNLKDKIEFLRAQRIPFYRHAHHTVGEEADMQQLVNEIRKGSPR